MKNYHLLILCFLCCFHESKTAEEETAQNTDIDAEFYKVPNSDFDPNKTWILQQPEFKKLPKDHGPGGQDGKCLAINENCQKDFDCCLFAEGVCTGDSKTPGICSSHLLKGMVYLANLKDSTIREASRKTISKYQQDTEKMLNNTEKTLTINCENNAKIEIVIQYMYYIVRVTDSNGHIKSIRVPPANLSGKEFQIQTYAFEDDAIEIFVKPNNLSNPLHLARIKLSMKLSELKCGGETTVGKHLQLISNEQRHITTNFVTMSKEPHELINETNEIKLTRSHLGEAVRIDVKTEDIFSTDIFSSEFEMRWVISTIKNFKYERKDEVTLTVDTSKKKMKIGSDKYGSLNVLPIFERPSQGFSVTLTLFYKYYLLKIESDHDDTLRKINGQKTVYEYTVEYDLSAGEIFIDKIILPKKRIYIAHGYTEKSVLNVTDNVKYFHNLGSGFWFDDKAKPHLNAVYIKGVPIPHSEYRYSNHREYRCTFNLAIQGPKGYFYPVHLGIVFDENYNYKHTILNTYLSHTGKWYEEYKLEKLAQIDKHIQVKTLGHMSDVPVVRIRLQLNCYRLDQCHSLTVQVNEHKMATYTYKEKRLATAYEQMDKFHIWGTRDLMVTQVEWDLASLDF